MKSKINLLFILFFSVLFFASCSDERPGQIEKIRNSENSNREKINEIADISLKCITCGESKITFQTISDNEFFIYLEYYDKDFLFESTEQMQEIVKENIAKSVWRILHDTKDLGLEGITVSYFGDIMGELRYPIIQLTGERKNLEGISGFYTVDPYDTDDYDIIPAGSEQEKVIKEVIGKLKTDMDNTPNIEFK